MWNIVSLFLICSLEISCLDAFDPYPMHSIDSMGVNVNTFIPLKIVSRLEWLAQPPENDLIPMRSPSIRVIIAHTATEDCMTQAKCVFQVRFMQTFHIESIGLNDIAYNFLVGGDGAVYVGRGWDTQGEHTKGYNVKSICIAFIGTFKTKSPPEIQLIAAQRMIKEGVKLKKLREDYTLYGQRQLSGTENPGSALYEIIKKWKHWSEVISRH